MIKRLPNWLKIGFQARFGPNFTVELEAEIPKNLGWPIAYPLRNGNLAGCALTIGAATGFKKSYIKFWSMLLFF